MRYVYRAIGRRVAELRKQRGWSQERLAGKVQVARSYVNRIEAGTGRPTLDVIARVASALGIGLADLIGDAGPAARRRDRRIPAAIRELPDADLDLLGRVVARLRGPARRRGGRKPKDGGAA